MSFEIGQKVRLKEQYATETDMYKIGEVRDVKSPVETQMPPIVHVVWDGSENVKVHAFYELETLPPGRCNGCTDQCEKEGE